MTLLKRHPTKAEAEGFLGTDESMLVERFGHPVRIVESTYDNVKMTTTGRSRFRRDFIEKRQ